MKIRQYLFFWKKNKLSYLQIKEKLMMLFPKKKQFILQFYLYIAKFCDTNILQILQLKCEDFLFLPCYLLYLLFEAPDIHYIVY